MTLRDVLAALFSRPALTPSLDVTQVEYSIPDLPAALDGFLIAHISDLHIGAGRWLPARAPEAAERIRAERPDVVVNTGDFLQDHPDMVDVKRYVAPFVDDGQTKAEDLANLAVLGNHDYYAGDDVVRELRELCCRLGVRLLQNETVVVRRGRADMSFTGLDGQETGFDRALAVLQEAPRPRIVLVHDAHVAERLPEGAADLILAGHTHGGQVTLPGLTPLIVRRFNGSKYIEGWYRINGNPVYINRGLGCTGIPVRFRARPEVTFLRLRR